MRFGECGKTVFVIGHDQVLYPIGLFIGKFRKKGIDGKTIYQAAILHQNLRAVHSDYSHIIGMPSMLGRLLSESYMEVDVEKYISKHSQRDSMEADLIRKALPSRWSRATSDVGYSSSASVDLVDPSVRPKTPRGPRPRS